MTISELEDVGIRKLARHQTVVEGKASYSLPTRPSESDTRQMLEGHRKAGRLQENVLLDSALQCVASMESKIRKVKLSGLSGSEIRRFQANTVSNLVKSVEDKKAARLKSLLETADQRRRDHEAKAATRSLAENTARLVRLQELQLQHTFTDESAALARISAMERRGYDPAELLILSSKGKKATARAQQLRETVPEYLGDESGMGLLGELEELLELHPGELVYCLKDIPDVRQVVNVGDLLVDLSPTLEDVAV